MEERLPASDDSIPKLPLATYVVQVPRDQIYRVPPPEHAIKIEEHKRNSENQEASLICSILIPIVLITLIAGVSIITVRSTLYDPTTPEFAVTSIQGKDLGRKPEFKVTIQAKNQNTRMSVSYKERGETALFFKNKKIGIGSGIEGGGGGDATDLAVALAGNGLSPEMKKSLSDDKEKSMEVKVGLRVEMKSWLRNIEGMDMMISCDFRVLYSLMNITEISFTECKKL